jgi:hypothetical protein
MEAHLSLRIRRHVCTASVSASAGAYASGYTMSGVEATAMTRRSRC